MSHHILPRPCTGTPQPTSAPPTASQSHPYILTKPITGHLTPQCHCWGLFITTGAGDASGKPQPWAGGMKDREEEKGAGSIRLIPTKRVGAAPGSAWLVSLSHIPSRLGSFRAFLWVSEQVLGAVWAGLSSPHTLLPLSLTLCSFCSRGQWPVVHQPGLAGGAQPAGRCHGRPDLRGLPPAPEEEVSPPAQEVQPPQVTEFGILGLAAK